MSISVIAIIGSAGYWGGSPKSAVNLGLQQIAAKKRPLPLKPPLVSIKMIGLKRHIVQIVDYNPRWADLAAQACRRIIEVGADFIVEVQHVGSTAVPGLPAKPILDIAASVTSIDLLPELIKKLAVLGYIYRGDGQSSGGHLFVWESEPDVRTIHLHVVTFDDIQWTNYLRFRDLLRQETSVRERYAALKQELWNRFPNNRKLYTNSKHDFIQEALYAKGQQGNTGNRQGRAASKN
jgi:GrpB-like predicted nucleotidyltransferase (UPF0157 family)